MQLSDYIKIVETVSNVSKYLKWYINIVLKAKDRASTKSDAKKLLGYVESHHVLPKSFNLGGEKDLENIVHLSAREHFICHLLLTKLPKEYVLIRKMKKAFTYMLSNGSNHSDNRYINSNFYAYSRKCYSESNSRNGNPRFGKPGTFTGKTHSEESRRKISEARYGKPSPLKGKTSPLKGRIVGSYSNERIESAKKGLVGMKFYTNGINDIKLKPGQPIPEGFRPGRTNGVQKALENITKWNMKNERRSPTPEAV